LKSKPDNSCDLSGQSALLAETLLEVADVDDTATMGTLPDLSHAVPGFDIEEDALASVPVTRAIVRTALPIGVTARWRTLTSIPTLTNPVGRRDSMADPAAISICNTIIGVA